jgi:hypothetical protein
MLLCFLMLGLASLCEMSGYEGIFCIRNDVNHMACSQPIELQTMAVPTLLRDAYVVFH